MKTRLLLIVAVGLCVAAQTKPDAKKEDKDLVQGSWAFANGQRNGETPPDEVQSLKLSFKDDKLIAHINGEAKDGKFKIDATKKPKEITITIEDNGRNMEMKGIYEMDGDTLYLCFPSEPGGPTPKELTGKRGSKQMYWVLKRAKEVVTDEKPDTGKLPFSLDELRKVTGDPTRTESGSWYFVQKGKAFPYLVIIKPTEKVVSFRLENDPGNEFALTTLFSSNLFTNEEGKEVLKFTEVAKKQLGENAKNEAEKVIGRFKISYFENFDGWWVLKLEGNK